MKDTLKFARYYVFTLGFSVIPLRPKKKEPAISSWTPYRHRKPTGKELKRWFENTDNNIGIVCGPISGNLAVPDYDQPGAMQWAIDQNFPRTAQVKTGKPEGYHQLFQTDGRPLSNFQNRSDMPGIDFRAEGGYVVAPPSIHPNGTVYKWVIEPTANNGGVWPLAMLPEIFYKVGGQEIDHKVDVDDLYDGVPEGERNDSLARLLGSWLSGGESKDGALELANNWNDELPDPLPEKELLRTWKSICDKHERDSKDITLAEGGSDGGKETTRIDQGD